jgi:hypothetical protein
VVRAPHPRFNGAPYYRNIIYNHLVGCAVSSAVDCIVSYNQPHISFSKDQFIVTLKDKYIKVTKWRSKYGVIFAPF